MPQPSKTSRSPSRGNRRDHRPRRRDRSGRRRRHPDEVPETEGPPRDRGQVLLVHAVTAAEGTGPAELVVVLRHERDRVAEHLAEHAAEVTVADQDEVPGTGRAVQCGLEQVTAAEGTVLVTYGDVPLLD